MELQKFGNCETEKNANFDVFVVTHTKMRIAKSYAFILQGNQEIFLHITRLSFHRRNKHIVSFWVSGNSSMQRCTRIRVGWKPWSKTWTC